jgi:hypothetical protein
MNAVSKPSGARRQPYSDVRNILRSRQPPALVNEVASCNHHRPILLPPRRCSVSGRAVSFCS